MSKPRYNWWPFVLNMVRDYPERAKEIKDLRQQKITADLSGMPRGGGASRTTEGISMRELEDKQAQREYEAVHQAISRTRSMKEAKLRLEVLKLTMWNGCTIRDAEARVAGISGATIKRYRRQFILLVGKCYGFMTEEEYVEELKNMVKGKKLVSKKLKGVV